VSIVGTTSSVLGVQLLSVIPRSDSVHMQTMMYSIVPTFRSLEYPNAIHAKSIVAIFTEYGMQQSVQILNFSCAYCNSATRQYNSETMQCECLPGSVPVCLPCSTNCEFNAFTINPNNQTCLIASIPLVSNSVATRPDNNARYNMHCMACTATFYCVDGTVNGVRACPASRPYVLAKQAFANENCVCAPGYAESTGLEIEYYTDSMSNFRQRKKYDDITQIETSQLNASISCTMCPDTSICTPKHMAKRYMLQCPENTKSTLTTVDINMEAGAYRTIRQACSCVSGYYAITATMEVRVEVGVGM